MAVRGLRIRWSYSFGFDGNLQLPSESLRVALANTYADSNRNAYCNCDCDGNCHGDRNSHTHADGDANIDTVRRKMFSDTAASSDSSPSPVGRRFP